MPGEPATPYRPALTEATYEARARADGTDRFQPAYSRFCPILRTEAHRLENKREPMRTTLLAVLTVVAFQLPLPVEAIAQEGEELFAQSFDLGTDAVVDVDVADADVSIANHRGAGVEVRVLVDGREVEDGRELFEANVVSPFVDAYVSGRTPSPCVWCNRSVKMRELLAKIEMLGKAQMESEKVETMEWARVYGREYVRSSYLMWFLSVCVGWYAFGIAVRASAGTTDERVERLQAEKKHLQDENERLVAEIGPLKRQLAQRG